MAAGYAFPAADGPDSPWPIFERILVTHEELALQAELVTDHEVKFAFVMRTDFGENGWADGPGRIKLGTACMPRVTGALAGLFDQLLEDTLGYRPDFLITINSEWWSQATDQEREILVFHEALHCGQATDKYGSPKFNRQTGAPILSMIAHDVEEFESVVRRYGAWKSDIRSFLDAAAEGPRRDNGGPRIAAFDDLADTIRELVGDDDIETLTPEIIKARIDAQLAKLEDSELPENVSNVDDLDDKRNRGERSHPDSDSDVF